MAESNNLVLKKISDITDFKFFIPSFQRGYRWDIMQVEDLLNDIKEYIDIENKESFLCLQPVVVYEKKNKDDKQNENQNENEKDKTFVVIDGQQRLTAIAIIKYYLSEHKEQLKKFDYKIEYEKYDKSLSDLLKPYDEENMYNNIHDKVKAILGNNTRSLDEYHIILSYLSIAKYFNELNDKDKYIKEFKKLFSSTIDNYSIQFIWYNVTDEITNKVQKDGKEETKINETKAINIFTRLNIGKIPLTDAELIKALFLKKDNFKDNIDNDVNKISIANLWYEMEKDLNDDSFWYFLSKDNIPRNKRINLLLVLNSKIKSINHVQNYNLFSEYYKKMKNSLYIDIWAEIKQIYYTLKEWYNNYEMYHYIGYLTNLDYNLKTLYEKYHTPREIVINSKNEKIKKLNKQIQRDNIKNIIRKELNLSEQLDLEIENITYGKGVKKILLFLEIFSAIKANESSIGKLKNEIVYRFPFNLYINEQWDIEHISSQTENKFQKNDDKLIWLENHIKYYKSNKDKFEKIITKLDTYECNFLLDIINDTSNDLKDKLKENIEHIQDKWDCIFNAFTSGVEEQSQLDDNQKNSIGNLVLLNSKINRSYKNAIFPVKRMVIIDESKKNTFIPVNTKNAFLKYYNANETGTLNEWDSDDYENYINYIYQKIKEFKEATEHSNDNNK